MAAGGRQTHTVMATRLHPDARFVWFMYSAALRKLGRYDEAYAAARDGHSLAPGWQTAVALALVCRARGDTEEALARYREAVTYQPTDVSARNDIGDILFNDGRLDEAAAAYGEALAVKPDEPWALPSYLYCMDRLHPGDGWDARLRQLVTKSGANERAQTLLQSLSAALDAYVTALPPATEACVNLARAAVS